MQEDRDLQFAPRQGVRGLGAAVEAHNAAVGSFQSRLLPTVRRIGEHGIAAAERVEAPPVVELAVRTPSRAERSAPAELRGG
jgi:hypothetical protein